MLLRACARTTARCCTLVILLTAVVGSNEISKHTKFVGESIEVRCTVTNVSMMRWNFRQREDRTELQIANSEGVNQKYRDRFQSNCSTSGICRLVIIEIRHDDAGLYSCMEFSGSTMHYKLTARLVVLDKARHDQDIAEEVSIQHTSYSSTTAAAHLQSAARSGGEPNSTQHRPAAEDIGLTDDSKPIAGILLVVLSVATFAAFVLAMTYIVCRSKIKGLFNASRNTSCVVQNTAVESGSQVYAEVSRPSRDMDNVSGDTGDPVPRLPSRSCSIRTGSCTGSGFDADYRATTNVYVESATNNDITENTPQSVNPTYAELSVSIRTATSRSLTRSAVSVNPVYADINHLVSQRTTRR